MTRTQHASSPSNGNDDLPGSIAEFAKDVRDFERENLPCDVPQNLAKSPLLSVKLVLY
jgi:hypothetical protein